MSCGSIFRNFSIFSASSLKVGRKLPEERTELFAEQQNARSQEIGQRRFDFAETLNVRDVTRAFYGEFEIRGRGGIPGLETGRPLQ